MNISQAIHRCHNNGIKVYPIHKGHHFYIEVEISGRKKLIDKPIKQQEINGALEKTVLFYANKL